VLALIVVNDVYNYKYTLLLIVCSNSFVSRAWLEFVQIITWPQLKLWNPKS